MSCTFWNMRRRLKAQKQKESIVTNLAEAQAEEKRVFDKEQKDTKKPIKRAKTKE